ncbi:NAD(P)H-dependent oxidoreductase [Candidatus Stoquefichus massiliensis]|uniref:NAD(P)H-dependent oxidoreductase n=1 Tax=Candidatus Stoquefichus massiliensis TaxID=1470350 RepID=UPI0004BC8865|nr:NAD(P)H-dependent oxidoreductase [Candidatus Stoquefichus massiliensis]
MIITLIHGQNHKGCSYHIVTSLIELLKPEKIYEFFLPQDFPNFCIGCYMCLEKGVSCRPHEKHISLTAEAITVSNLLVFTTPVYYMRCSAPMKNFLGHFFINWVVHRPKEANYHKKQLL